MLTEDNFMKKKLIYTLIFTLFLSMNSFAGKYLGSLQWKLSDLKDKSGEQISTEYENLFLDIELGSVFFHAYGTFFNASKTGGLPAVGSGYFINNSNENKPNVVRLDLRAGVNLYAIQLVLPGLNGIVDVFDLTGEPVASGKITLINNH
jgi:hypothetical protein